MSRYMAHPYTDDLPRASRWDGAAEIAYHALEALTLLLFVALFVFGLPLVAWMVAP